MGIEADKESIGSIVWVDRCKFAQDRANYGDHNTSDIGVLWAEDHIATQAATIEALKGDSQYSITPLIDFGQVAIGDGLIFQTGDEFIVITAKAVLNKGLASEEVIYRNKKNHYFITSMVLSGESHAKNILVVKNPAPPADTGESE